ncbi:hypothetical protein, partial [uncultured Selenomonas sp.]|uniref:hypothetical protein n=1 Tax=uncultured Selenomonas sp. TaxID=159275 RepID=UPI0028DBAB6E
NHIDDSFLHCLVFKEHRRSLGFFAALASRPSQYTRFSESCQAPFFYVRQDLLCRSSPNLSLAVRSLYDLPHFT